MDQRVLLDGLDSVPASACAVRFRKSDLAPCYLLETSNVHGLNTRSKLRSSELHCAALWWSSGKSDSRFAWRSRATPLAHKWKPIFFWISLPIFTCILLHQQNSKKKKKKSWSSIYKHCVYSTRSTNAISFQNEHARHLRNAYPKKRRGALATDPRYRDVLSEIIWQGYFMLEVSPLSIKTIVYFICVRCRCMSIMY